MVKTASRPAAPHAETAARTRIAAYLLVEYLVRLGVDVVFGLCGHTVIALLDALRKSRIRFISTNRSRRMPPMATPGPPASQASC